MRTHQLVLAIPLAALLWAGAATGARADSIRTFALDGNGSQSLSGSQLVVTLTNVQVGSVSFDVVLTVTGSSTLTQTSSGLGVKGGGSNLLNAGESLTFTLTLQKVTGGAAAFAGFTYVDLSFFGPSAEKVVLSRDGSLSTSTDNFLAATAPGDLDVSTWSPTAFTLFGKDAGGVTTSLRVDAVKGAFRAAAPVPEPASLALLGAGLAGLGLWSRRRPRP